MTPFLRVCILLAAAVPAAALEHAVTDFRPDWSGAASDAVLLDPGWRDSLLLKAKRYLYKTVLVARLNNDAQGNILNTPSAGAVAAATGDYAFKVAYVQWATVHNATNANSPGVANIFVKNIALSPDTAGVDAAGTMIAGQEVPAKRAPVFLNFAGAGAKYAAYWGSNSPPGPIRRTTHLNAQGGGNAVTWGQDVNPASPVSAAGYGKVGAGMRPGSGGEDFALAYETQAAPTGKFEVRWESIGAGTSVPSAPYGTAILPEDFAVALDSAGNTIVLWRQQQALAQGSPSDLWMAGFDPSHAEIIAPVKLETDIFADDTISTVTTTYTHYYRPFAIAAQANKRFLIVFGRRQSPTVARIYARSLTLDSLGPGTYDLSAPADLTPPGDAAPFWYMYPDVKSTADRVAVAWFKRGSGNYVQRLMGSIFNKNGPVYTTAGRVDMDFAGENVAFGAPTNGLWYQYHYFKCASLALDERGDIVAAWDSGAASKAALVKNTSIYYDSGAFVSRILEARNPAVASFVFDPASDSIAFAPIAMTAANAGYAQAKLAVSSDSSFSAADAGFNLLTDTLRTARRFFRYKVELTTNITGDTATTNLMTAKVKSLTLAYDIKPARPGIDSLKRGAAPMAAYDSAASYVLLPRKDSLRLVVSGFDADDNGIAFRLRLGGKTYPDVNGTRIAPGRFRAAISVMPPDTLLDPLPLSLTAIDSNGWASRALSASFAYANIPPSETAVVLRNRGRDSASVYLPAGGGVDTVAAAPGSAIPVQRGDSLRVTVRFADGNDDSLAVDWLRNSTRIGSGKIAVADSLSIGFAPDGTAPWIDTLVLSAADPNAAAVRRFPVRFNRTPEVDSILHARYQGSDSAWRTGPFDRVADFAADTGLILPSGLPSEVEAAVSDSDMAYGDSLSVRWKVWRKGTGACPAGQLSCYQAVDSADGEKLARVFSPKDEYLTVRVTDRLGAFRERKLALEYSVLDTAGATDFDASLKVLDGDIDFILGSDIRDTAVRAEIRSQGTAPLRILSAATRNNDSKWLDVKLEWQTGSPPRADSAKFAGPTTVNALAGGKVVVLPRGAGLTFEFRFRSDSLRGDSVLADTLVVQTNDFAHPELKIPFRMVYNDLPLVTLGAPGLPGAGPPGGFNASGLPRFLPSRSSLSLTFSETVRIPDPARTLRVYSLLDSLKNPRSYRDIPGTYAYNLLRPAKRSAGASGRGEFGKVAAAADSLADQLIFVPAYDRPSDSLKVKPPPGSFAYRDVLRIRVSNAIVDRAGNGLDLRLDRVAAAPGTLDTVFTARVDTNFFQVAKATPEAGHQGWSPEDPLRIRFNRKLSLPPPLGKDSLTRLALGPRKAAASPAVRVTSHFRPRKAYDFASIDLEDGDSTLVLRVYPRLPSRDTVTVALSGGILDSSGLSLDGNGDHIPQWLYDSRDSVDAYTYTFSTTEADFYVFPNPFHFADARHREKGTVTFKNLNSLRGFAPGDDVTLRISTMNGDLVYDSGRRDGDPLGRSVKPYTSLEWDLRNIHGSMVGTGVYIYSLIDGRKMLRKGKVAVVR